MPVAPAVIERLSAPGPDPFTDEVRFALCLREAKRATVKRTAARRGRGTALRRTTGCIDGAGESCREGGATGQYQEPTPTRERGLKLLKMEFRSFLQAIVLLPCQIVRTGRRIVWRILNYTPWLRDLFATFERLQRLAPG